MNKISQKIVLIITVFCLKLGFATSEFHKPKTHQGIEVDKSYYNLSYVEQHEQAEWVFYLLEDRMLEGKTKRTNDFREDPTIPTQSATPQDYQNSGYSRGHLVPAGDMKLNKKAMSETFFMSNMSPQDYDFNSGLWNNLEIKVREWAKEKGHLYVASGPILHDHLPTLPRANISIPEEYYKVLYFEAENPDDSKMIAFLMPNNHKDKPLSHFVVATDLIEEMTGIDFFPNLQNKSYLESDTNTSFWF